MDIEFIKRLFKHKNELSAMILDAQTTLAVENTGLSRWTCCQIIQNCSTDTVRFNDDLTNFVFPYNISVSPQTHQLIRLDDLDLFLDYCHRNEIYATATTQYGVAKVTIQARYKNLSQGVLSSVIAQASRRQQNNQDS